MFIKPDYNLKNIYEIDLDDLKNMMFILLQLIFGKKM